MNNSVILDEKAQSIIKYYLPNFAVAERLADFYSVFCDPSRIRLLSALTVTEMCVTDLASIVEMNQSTVSHQLKLLRSLGVVKQRRDGKIIYYSAIENCVKDVILYGRNFIGV